MLITVNGLITRVYRTGDHDHVIHLLTEDRGRLSVMVKGRAAGRHAAAPVTQLFTYGNYELYRGKAGDLYWFRGGSVLRHFFEITSNLPAMALASYLCDVADTLSEEGNTAMEAEELLRMMLNTLHTIAKGDKPYALIKGVVELRIAALMGYRPDLTGCARCGEGYPDQLYLDVMNGRLICADCQTTLNRLAGRVASFRAEELGERRIICPISASALAAMRYALAAPERKIFAFSLTDPEELRAFSNAAETYLLNQLEQDFDTLQFYRTVAD